MTRISTSYWVHALGIVHKTRQALTSAKVEILGMSFEANLLVLDLGELDVILGMNWLARYDGVIICAPKCIEVRHDSGQRLLFSAITGFISTLFSVDAKPLPEIKDVPIVCEFSDVFPNELPGLPPDREF